MRGKVKKTVLIRSNDPDSPLVTLTVSVDVEITLGFEPPSLSLGEIERGKMVTRTVKLIGKLAKDAKVTGAQASDGFEVTLKQIKKNGEPHVEFQIRVKPSTPMGTPLRGNVQVQTDRPGAGILPVNVFGYVVGNITARPPQVLARAAQPGEPVKLQFEVLALRATARFQVKSVRDDQDRFTGRATALKAGQHYRIEADIPPELLEKTFIGMLVVKTNDKGTPELMVPYTVVVPPPSTPR